MTVPMMSAKRWEDMLVELADSLFEFIKSLFDYLILHLDSFL
ncbi:hypothetical protein FJSC11DRAFT_1713 [Fischerella thermalis JSC-11]|uniref:Uncharacterized protein n=1 Tax=Fischerella thermalis JSC-11 TaxID=741277 RepID=G6FSG6_9CYAN|nr:hypothetical protein FJSC11DRAFT_1713 [Fischerella thermalis JSC-11]BAU05962.1 hypothetical protein FIS3754_18730 [Fischerella sp. NIES-3754]BCX08243.1 MAG: hypothetical protein KatS3mg066_2102 [Fischerella sp.]